MPARSPAKAIALAAVVAGTLDLSDALLLYGLGYHVTVTRLLQGIAAHLIGRPAYSGGFLTAMLGLAIHYVIALSWTVLFVLAATKVAFLKRHAVVSGLLYGVLVFVLMNYVVLPLTLLYRPSPLVLSIAYVNAVAAIVFLIGLPIALINKRYA